MTKKNPENKSEPEKKIIRVDRTRGGGSKKKPDLFANLRKLPDHHPLDNIVPYPVNQNIEPLVNQQGDNSLTELVNQETEDRRTNLVNQETATLLTKNGSSVNQNSEILSTKPEIPVNLLTKTPELLTKTKVKKTDPVNKLTKNENLVNQKTDNWKIYERARSAKTSVIEGFRTSPEMKQKIKEFCAKEGIDKQDFYNLAAIHYMEHLVNQNSQDSVNKLTLDDRRLIKMWKTKTSVINLYLAYNPENKWKFPDDEAGVKYNDTDLRLIELGIIETQFNSGFKKINSFSYYLNEIDNFAGQNLSEEMLTFLTAHYREKWKSKTGKEINV